MQRRERRKERKDAVSRKWKRIAVEGREKVKGRESVKAAARGEGEDGGAGGVLAINAPHKKSSPSLMGSTLLEGTC